MSHSKDKNPLKPQALSGFVKFLDKYTDKSCNVLATATLTLIGNNIIILCCLFLTKNITFRFFLKKI